MDDFVQTAFEARSLGGKLKLSLGIEGDKYIFSYSENGSEMNKACELSAKFLTCEIVGRCFTGGVIGVYAQADEETDACAIIRSFISEISE